MQNIKMKNSWNYDLIDILKKAQLGDTSELNLFLNQYAPWAVANENYTILLILRHFKVSFWQGERTNVLNCPPEDENFQWGITIVTSDENSGSQINVYLPNKHNYKGLKIQQEEITIQTDNQDIVTNSIELSRKLWLIGTEEEDIESGFNSLSNEQYKVRTQRKPIIKNKTIVLSSFCTLTYNEERKWYEGIYTNNDTEFKINIYHSTPKKLQNLLHFAKAQIEAHYYNDMLLAMEATMIKLKNDVWLGEDKYTGEDETPISVTTFRKRVSISSITFYDDCSSVIYCNDDDIFFGHTITIDVDKKGKYQGADLAG